MKNWNWKTVLIAIIVFLISHMVLEAITERRHPFWAIVITLAVSYTIHVLFFSYPEIKKLQKQADLLGWTFISAKKNGRYRDYIYRKDIVFVTISWTQKCAIVNGQVYKDFVEVERDFEKLRQETKEYVSAALGGNIRFPTSFYNKE